MHFALFAGTGDVRQGLKVRFAEGCKCGGHTMLNVLFALAVQGTIVGDKLLLVGGAGGIIFCGIHFEIGVGDFVEA